MSTVTTTAAPHVIVVGYRDDDGEWHYRASEPMDYYEAVKACRQYIGDDRHVAFARPFPYTIEGNEG